MSIMFYMSHAIQNSCIDPSNPGHFKHLYIIHPYPCHVKYTCTCTFCYIYLNFRNRLFWIGGYGKNSTWYCVGDANNITMDVQPGDPVDFNNPGSTWRGQCAALTEDYSVNIGVYKSSYEYADKTFGYTVIWCDLLHNYVCEQEKLSVPKVSPTNSPASAATCSSLRLQQLLQLLHNSSGTTDPSTTVQPMIGPTTLKPATITADHWSSVTITSTASIARTQPVFLLAYSFVYINLVSGASLLSVCRQVGAHFWP